MSAANILPEKGVKVKINGKDYHFRFTNRIIAELAAKHGSIKKALENIPSISPGEYTEKNLVDLCELVHLSLKKENPEMTFDFVYDEIDIAEISQMIEHIIQALKNVIQAKEETTGKKKTPPAKA